LSNLNQQKSKFEARAPKTKIRIFKVRVLPLKFGEFKFAKIKFETTNVEFT
jgi:hypothetical protein